MPAATTPPLPPPHQANMKKCCKCYKQSSKHSKAQCWFIRSWRFPAGQMIFNRLGTVVISSNLLDLQPEGGACPLVFFFFLFSWTVRGRGFSAAYLIKGPSHHPSLVCSPHKYKKKNHFNVNFEMICVIFVAAFRLLRFQTKRRAVRMCSTGVVCGHV